jgi:hypothetical protein
MRYRIREVVVWENGRMLDKVRLPTSLDELTPLNPAPSPKEDALRIFEKLGRSVYKEGWETVKERNVDRVSDGRAVSAADLSLEQINKLNDGLRTLQAKKGVANGK